MNIKIKLLGLGATLLFVNACDSSSSAEVDDAYSSSQNEEASLSSSSIENSTPSSSSADAIQASSSSEADLASSSSSVNQTADYGPDAVLIGAKGKSFSMGSNDLSTWYADASLSASDQSLLSDLLNNSGTLEDAVHTVSFTSSFYMDATEITQAQILAVLEAAGQTIVASALQDSWSSAHNTAHMPVGDLYPAVVSSPYYIALYANARSVLEGLTPAYTIGSDHSFTTSYSANGYRLPTEAEWEFAARGGSATGFFWNKDCTLPLSAADSALVSEYAVWKANSGDLGTGSSDYGPHIVASKKPNAYGLYDMSGNLSEFVNNLYDWQSYAATALTDPQDASALPDDLEKLHKRGGNWMNPALYLRSSNRTYKYSAYKELGLGFRLVRKAN